MQDASELNQQIERILKLTEELLLANDLSEKEKADLITNAIRAVEKGEN